jgi:hypothetical protein
MYASAEFALEINGLNVMFISYSLLFLPSIVIHGDTSMVVNSESFKLSD